MKNGDNCILYIVELPISATVVAVFGDCGRNGDYTMLSMQLSPFSATIVASVDRALVCTCYTADKASSEDMA